MQAHHSYASTIWVRFKGSLERASQALATPWLAGSIVVATPADKYRLDQCGFQLLRFLRPGFFLEPCLART